MNETARNVIIIVVAAIALIALFIGVWAVANAIVSTTDKANETEASETDEPLVPDYPVPETDPNQKPMEDDPGGSFETGEGGAGVNLTYTPTALVDLSDETVKLYFANPKKSTNDMIASLVIDGTVICRSKKIVAGNQITELKLQSGVKDILPEGVYNNAKYVVGCYDPTTNEKAIVELVGAGVTVTVVQ